MVGIDLAGGVSPAHVFRLADYAPVYRRAEELGLGRTVHAGEGAPVEEIRAAVEILHAQRIGHGTTLLNDPSLVEVVIERGIVIDACPTSNVHTGAIGSLEAHPLPAWLRAGVRACICTDNTLLSAVDAPEEHRRALTIPGMDERKLRAAIAFSHQGAFARG